MPPPKGNQLRYIKEYKGSTLLSNSRKRLDQLIPPWGTTHVNFSFYLILLFFLLFYIGDLYDKNLFFIALEAGKSEINVPVKLATGKSHFPGLQTSAFSQCPSSQIGDREFWSLFFFLKWANPIMGAPPSRLHLPKPSPPNTITLEVRAST